MTYEDEHRHHIERLLREGGLDPAQVAELNKLFYDFTIHEHMVGIGFATAVVFSIGFVIFACCKWA